MIEVWFKTKFKNDLSYRLSMDKRWSEVNQGILYRSQEVIKICDEKGNILSTKIANELNEGDTILFQRHQIGSSKNARPAKKYVREVLYITYRPELDKYDAMDYCGRFFKKKRGVQQ
jgi:hypothetical protein